MARGRPPEVQEASAAKTSHGLHWNERCAFPFSSYSNDWVKQGCLVWFKQFKRWSWQDWALRSNGTGLVRRPSGFYLDIWYGKWYVQVIVNPTTGAWVWNRASDFAIRQQIGSEWIGTWHQQMCVQAFGRRC